MNACLALGVGNWDLIKRTPPFALMGVTDAPIGAPFQTKKQTKQRGIPVDHTCTHFFQGNRILKLLVQSFSHYGGTSGQVGISASEVQPARPYFEAKMWTIAHLLIANFVLF